MTCGCLKPRCNSPKPVVFHCENDGRDVEFIELGEFLPRVTLVAKGVPDEVALEYLRQAAQTLAKQSLLLEREAYLDVQAGVRDYYLANGEHEQVHYVSHIALGKPKHCGVPKPLGAYDCREFRFEPNDKIILAQAPKTDAENRLYVRYLAVPNQTACEVDKLLFDRYHDVIVNGALASLLLMRQYQFADPQMAIFYDRQFKQGITAAKIETARRFTPSPQTFNHWENM